MTDIPVWMPEWSPDSKWVAFSNYKEIYRVSVDGGIPEQLTSEGKVEVAPSWSPQFPEGRVGADSFSSIIASASNSDP